MLEARWKIVGIKHAETTLDSTLCLFLCSVIVLFEAFLPSFKIARSIENKPYLETVTMLLSIGNNSSQWKGGERKSEVQTPEIRKYDTCKTLT